MAWEPSHAERHPLSSRRANTLFAILVGVAFMASLAWISRFRYLLFHGLAELVSVCVAWSVFALAWSSRRYRTEDNGYLLVIGVASFFVGGLDLVHTLAYRGMGVFPDYDANLPTQLWITSRYLLSLSLLAASLLLYAPPASMLQGRCVLTSYQSHSPRRVYLPALAK